mmetsp:Transcript_63940/g.148947  ORF Transcript_63940/g.148947 Transcript_63940/m.148947 type:complete len:304 (-) Transcript_63940:17-928(-)
MLARQTVEEGLLLDQWPQEAVQLPPRPNCTTCWVDAGDAQFLFAVESYSAATFGAGMQAFATRHLRLGAMAVEVMDRLVAFLKGEPERPWFGPHPVVRIMALQLHSFGAFAKNRTAVQTWSRVLDQALEVETASDPPGYDAPFPLVPTGELLGTLLLKSALGSPPRFPRDLSPQERTLALRALELFSGVARVSPNRPGCLLGVARAHRVLQQRFEACKAYTAFLHALEESDPGLWVVDEARNFTDGNMGFRRSTACGQEVAYSFVTGPSTLALLLLAAFLPWVVCCHARPVRCCFKEPLLSCS